MQDTSGNETVAKTYKVTYPRKEVSLADFFHEKIVADEPTIYAVEWDGVVFELFIYAHKSSDKAVVFSNGAFNRKALAMPYFARASWYQDLDTNVIAAFDPTLYLGKANLCWGYGTNKRWYLQDIAFLIYSILKKLHISNTVFSGSSGGGYTSLVLACLLRGRAFVINPQLDATVYFPQTVQRLEDTALMDGETLLTERLRFADVIKREQYCPPVLMWQNIQSPHDMKKQITTFMTQLAETQIAEVPITIHFYSDERGHSGMPEKSICIDLIHKCLKEDEETHVAPEPEWLLHYDLTMLEKELFFEMRQLQTKCDDLGEKLFSSEMQRIDILSKSNDCLHEIVILQEQLDREKEQRQKKQKDFYTTKKNLQYKIKLRDDKIVRMQNYTSMRFGRALLDCRSFRGVLKLPRTLLTIFRERKSAKNGDLDTSCGQSQQPSS